MKICTRCYHKAEDAGYKYCRACREYFSKRYRENHDTILESNRQRYHENIEYEHARSRKYAKEHPEKAHERHVRWYGEHKEDKLEYYHQWYQDNKEQHRESCARWVEENYDHYKEIQREWKKANIEKCRIYWHNRMARIKGNGGTLPPDVEEILFEEQNGLCYLCGDLLYGRLDDPPSIEHMIPVSRGGSNVIENIGLAHLSCNSKKGTKTYEEFLQTR